MNGYANLREDYASYFISVLMEETGKDASYKEGIYKYFEELFELNKPLYVSSGEIRTVGCLIKTPTDIRFIIDIYVNGIAAIISPNDIVSFK